MSQKYPLTGPECRKLSSAQRPEQTFLMALCVPNW